MFTDHGGRLAILRVDVMVEVGNDGRELLLRLLVEVRYCNTSSEDSIIGVGDRRVRSGFCSLCW